MPNNQSGSIASPLAAKAAGTSGGAAETASGGSGPCKLTAVAGAGNEFQASALSMPISISLLTPDGKTEFLSISIFKQSNLNSPLPNPPSPSATSFTLNLPALAGDSYVVFMVLGSLPTAKPVWIAEACAGQTKLDWIATPVNTTGEFVLVVI